MLKKKGGLGIKDFTGIIQAFRENNTARTSLSCRRRPHTKEGIDAGLVILLPNKDYIRAYLSH